MVNDREYEFAARKYAEYGVYVDKQLSILASIPVSLHCWQGDDVGGFEHSSSQLGGGLAVTGNYFGKARTIDELRQDYEKAFSLIPGKHRVNLHAIYGDFGSEPVDRNEITADHYQSWIDWAKKQELGIDFNATLFSHPKADVGFTLSSKNEEIRNFWIDHVIRCREISAQIGKQLGNPVIHNLWIPDGTKDIPVDRLGHRLLLKESLDEIYSQKLSSSLMKDAIEGKLFGLGSESFVVGSHDFYLSYAIANNIILTMDMGHYHPTESVADKISAVLPFTRELLLHVSRAVRWDSDHVVILNDDLVQLAEEIVRSRSLGTMHIALDFFDASINRIAAWVIGARSTLKSLLYALLQPWEMLREYEEEGKNFQRLALLEELKSLPHGVIWDYYCSKFSVPVGVEWTRSIEQYEVEVLKKRV
ncbi:MAG: L-rhamnose isomerase [Candidatus Odinarchaeota archaeon]